MAIYLSDEDIINNGIASQTPGPGLIPIANGQGKLDDGWISASFERTSNKGIANGYASLDTNALVPLSQIPTPLTGKDADTVDGYHASSFEKVANKGVANGYASLDANGNVVQNPANAGLNDGQICILPTATVGQVLTRGASGWVAQAPSSGGFNSRVRAHLSASQSVAANTNVKVTFNVEDFDGNNEYDPTTNYRFTAAAAGYYLISARLDWYPVVSGYYYTCRIYLNGAIAQVSYANASTSTYLSTNLTALMYLKAGDYIEVYGENGGNAAVYIQSGAGISELYIHRLS